MKEVLKLLYEHFTYVNGKLICIKPTAKRVKVGDRFGSIRPDGYRQGNLGGRSYFEHRLIWLYHHKIWPKDQLDHIDRIRSHNKIENLREATQSQNQMNQAGAVGKTSKYKGVCWDKVRNKWKAQYRLAGKTKGIGYFTDELAAADAYDNTVRELHGLYANPNFKGDKC